MAANITPLGQRVLVKRITEAEEKTQGGIIIPDAHKEKPQEKQKTSNSETLLKQASLLGERIEITKEFRTTSSM